MAGARGKSGGLRKGAGPKRKNQTQPAPAEPSKSNEPPKPPEPPRDENGKLRTIDWNRVTHFARNGVEENTIRLALDLTDDLFDAATIDRFKKIIARGHALHRADLEVRINQRGKRTVENDGAVNILKMQAKEKLGWEREIPTQEVAPDLGTARSRLGDILLRLAQQTSQVEGRHVSVLEMLQREAETKPEDGK